MTRARPICVQCMSRLCHHFNGLPPHLAPREAEVLNLLRGGLTNKEIAAPLGLTEGTVKVYLSRIMQKLGLPSRLEAALWARDHKAFLETNGVIGKP